MSKSCLFCFRFTQVFLNQSCSVVIRNQLSFDTGAKSAVLFTLAGCEDAKPVNVELQLFEGSFGLGKTIWVQQQVTSGCRSPFRVNQKRIQLK